MITRRQIRAKVMQAVYACISSGQPDNYVFDLLLKEIHEEVAHVEKNKRM